MNQAILLQPVVFLVNVIFIPIYISYKEYFYRSSSDPSQYRYSLFLLDYPTIILILHFANIFFCYLNFKSKLSITPDGGIGPDNKNKLLEQFKVVYSSNDDAEENNVSDQVSSV